MLKRWKKPWISDAQFDELVKRALKILKKSNFIAFTYQATGANWKGVQTATKSIYPNNFLILPQSYSNSLLSEKQKKQLTDILIKNGLDKIIFSGLPKYSFNWLVEFHKANIKTGIIFHGGLAELNQNNIGQKTIKTLFKFAKEGKISKIYVIKEGLDKLFSNITNVETSRIIPPISIPENIKINNFNDGKIHIGIFGNNSYNKNRHTQVAAAALIPKSIVHIIGDNEFSYLLPNDRIISHQQLNRKEFLELLGSMDINLYCSYSESWGQVTLESIAMGVPCLTGNNSGIIDILEPEHKNYVLNVVDNPYTISQKIIEILQL
tara:strand:+ start:1288 stop:2253 length:966 start_codon:yes stop_codon:yes gene_type:complete